MVVQIALDEEGTLGGLNMYSTLSDDIDDMPALANLLTCR
jgi:hypothetical protein